MAFDTARPKFSGEGGTERSDGRAFSQGARRSFTVVSDAPTTDTAYGAKRATGIPRVRDPHPDDLSLRVVDVNAKRTSHVMWEVDVEYASQTAAGRNPLDEPAVVRWGFVTADEPIDSDVSGKPIVTKNNERYDPPISAPASDLVLTIVRNVSTFDPGLARTYKNAVNSDTFIGQAAGTARLEGIEAESVTDEDFSYWKLTVEIRFRVGIRGGADAKAWYRRVLHQGFIIRDAAGDAAAKWHRASDGHGGDSVVPVMLKSDGTQETDPNSAYWQEWQIYNSKPFSVLGLL